MRTMPQTDEMRAVTLQPFIRFCAAKEAQLRMLTEWEREFLASVKRSDRVSERQQDVVLRLTRKLSDELKKRKPRRRRKTPAGSRIATKG